MSSSDDYLEQLAKMVEEARQKQAEQNDATLPEESPEESSPLAVEEVAEGPEELLLPLPSDEEITRRTLANDEAIEKASSQNQYYAPGTMLEGQARQDIELPEGWENSGNAFDVKRGRHEALIEGVYSEEIDGPLEAPRKSRAKLLAGAFAFILFISIPVFFLLAKQNAEEQSNVPPSTSADPLQDFQAVYTNELGRMFPSRATPGENIYFNKLSNKINQNQLKAKGFSFESSDDSCKKSYINANEPCFLGTLNDKQSAFNTYYMHDVVHSNLFSTMAELEPANVTGANYSAVTVVELSGEPTRLLLITNKDNSGFFIEMPPEFDPETTLAFSEYISLLEPSK